MRQHKRRPLQSENCGGFRHQKMSHRNRLTNASVLYAMLHVVSFIHDEKAETVTTQQAHRLAKFCICGFLLCSRNSTPQR